MTLVLPVSLRKGVPMTKGGGTPVIISKAARRVVIGREARQRRLGLFLVSDFICAKISVFVLKITLYPPPVIGFC